MYLLYVHTHRPENSLNPDAAGDAMLIHDGSSHTVLNKLMPHAFLKVCLCSLKRRRWTISKVQMIDVHQRQSVVSQYFLISHPDCGS